MLNFQLMLIIIFKPNIIFAINELNVFSVRVDAKAINFC